jgi:hypothetical protein
MHWVLLHPKCTPEHLGYLPGFLSDDDPRSAAEQINANYAHGGGWHPFSDAWTLGPKDYCLHYPGDPPLQALAMTALRDEVIVFYDASLLMILQKDGSFEVARVD